MKRVLVDGSVYGAQDERILEALKDSAGAWIAAESLAIRFYGEFPTSSLRMAVHRLRKRLASSDLMIETARHPQHGSVYRIVVQETDAGG